MTSIAATRHSAIRRFLARVALFAGLASAVLGASAYAGTTGGISGFASAFDGTRVPSLRITIISAVTGALTTTTDRHGFFVILPLPPGRYTFLGSHVGSDYFFTADCLQVDVHADDVLQVHLWLDREWTISGCTTDIEADADPFKLLRAGIP